MAQKPTRDIFGIIFKNFWNSLRPRQFRGNYIGEDYFGNKYFEIPANPAIGKRKSSRWFEPADKDAFDQELTAEWEAWLRGRREEPPTREELVKNLQIMDMKKRNAAELDATYAKAKDEKAMPKQVEGQTIGTFPKYKDYEFIPGRDPPEKK
ncbi:GL25860 [Drosophila persimilis]|uniref:GL25860 n=1 Tax=Drosophila persimilis TaxID=7234 RepID=B4GJJ4_DROPE|nr:NADH dehydrogenase [ubiquinone] 1 alpha subcomplex assembly factor 2 [Drosophila persimilis]XP_017153122.1 NADH dehydrogenase [ubiquinone] 1 alpha subcomplex assembly factor 2 [Drosophila miranda]EDW36810.1 GL25860 [Drosophila persimilis]